MIKIEILSLLKMSSLNNNRVAVVRFEIIRRYIIYILGLYVFSFGIALVARSTLGATPVSSWAYSMSMHTGLSYGTYSFLIHLAMIAYQVIILFGHGLKKEWLNVFLQLPFSFLFGAFLDVNMALTNFLTPSTTFSCFIILAIACMIHAMGVFMQVSANVTMMSAEAFVYYTCKRWNLRFWKTKIYFDLSMVLLAIVTSMLFECSLSNVLLSVREGTAIDALLVGRIYKYYANHIHILNKLIMWNNRVEVENMQ